MNPDIEVFPVTWIKLIRCPCLIWGGFHISNSDLCEIRVISEPKLTMTLVGFWLRELRLARNLSGLESQKGTSWGSGQLLLEFNERFEVRRFSEIE